MKPPTDRQILFAQRIFNRTNVPLPEEKTSQAYFCYIRDNIEKYKNIMCAIRYEANRDKYNSRNKRNSYMDEDQDASWAASMDFDWL